MLRSLFLTLVLSAMASGPAASQASKGCETRVGPSLGTAAALPIPVLDHLGTISSSPFVHAFLLAHVAEHGNEGNWLTECARAFTEADLTDLDELRENEIEVRTMIEALRRAEETRMEQARLQDSDERTILALLGDLEGDPSLVELEAYAPYVEEYIEDHCGGDEGEGQCTPLRRFLRQMEAVGAAWRAWERAEGTIARLDSRIAQLEEELATVRRAWVRDSIAAASDTAVTGPAAGDTMATEGAPTVGAAGGALQAQEGPGRMRDAVERLESLRAERAATTDILTASEERLAREFAKLRPLRISAGNALTAGPERESLSVTIGVSDRGTGPPSDTRVEAPATTVVQVSPTLGSTSITMELADFVIDRAKRELVLGFLAGLYSVMLEDPLLQDAFGETFQLMHGLSAPNPPRLSVVAAGRVPLTVWQATLATDLQRLPVALLQSDPRRLCGENPHCRTALTDLRPVAEVVERLLRRDGVLEILEDAPLIALGSGVELPPPIVHGMGIVAGVARSYRVQGLVESADPQRFPYILSTETLRGLGPRQRDAFLRVLLLRGAPAQADPTAPDATEVLGAVGRIAEAVETIVQESTEPGGMEPERLVRSVFASLGAGADIAVLLSADTTLARRVSDAQTQWEGLVAVIEPLQAGEYGLAVSRTTVFLREVTGDRISQSVLTLAGLATSLSEAQSGEQVRAAFESAASPVGGWQAKRYREGPRTSVTAFPGGVAGWEWVLDNHEEALTLGVSLPIGIEHQLLGPRESGDAPGCWLGFCSLGVFFPVVDLGALLSYRLDDSETVASEPNTSFRQVFAPGFFLTLGVARSPISLLVGGQFMPSLRSVTGPDGGAGHAVRAGAAITIDVTLFHF